MKIANVCVYCGSQNGNDPDLVEAAAQFGRLLAGAGVGPVYGGASIGVMGALARSVLESGGHVTGVIPEFLFKAEVPLHSVSELIVTDSMHSRKKTMFDRSDAFVALPGGIGTLEEVIEMLTWAQLGRHRHPIVLANLKNFWKPLVDLLDHMVETQFVNGSIHGLYDVVDEVEDILPRIEASLR